MKYVPALTLLELESRVGDKLREITVVCPQNGTAVLKGLRHACHGNYCTITGDQIK